jgi:lysyl-tRNA synthetase class 1
VVRDAVPAAAADLDATQRRFLAMLSNAAERQLPQGGEAWQALIFTLARDDELPPRKAFEAIYRAFLGRANGPRAGWLLASLDPDFVSERAWEASGWTVADGPPGLLPVGG